MGAPDELVVVSAPDAPPVTLHPRLAAAPAASALATSALAVSALGAPGATPLREPAPVTGPIVLRQRRVGLSDLRIFPLALGAAAFGSTVAADDARRILDTYLDLGGNVVDTADSDGDGASETVIGTWMHDGRRRDEMVIATRVGRGTEHPGVTVGALTRSVEGSLRRLRTDRIDLLCLGVDDDAVPFEETLLAASALVSAGKVRQIGLASHSGNRIIEARVIAAQHGAAPVVAVQTEYGLLSRAGYETVLAGVVRQLALGLMPRFSLVREPLRTRGRRLRPPRVDELRAQRVLAVLDEIARDQHVAPVSVAIGWLLTKQNVVAPVVGASSPEQVLDLVAATSLHLTRRQLTRLDRVSERPSRRPGGRRSRQGA